MKLRNGLKLPMVGCDKYDSDPSFPMTTKTFQELRISQKRAYIEYIRLYVRQHSLFMKPMTLSE